MTASGTGTSRGPSTRTERARAGRIACRPNCRGPGVAPRPVRCPGGRLRGQISSGARRRPGSAETYGSEAAVTDASPTPPNRQDPHLDPADDSDEPAFDWMKPASPARGPTRPPAPGPAAGPPRTGPPATGGGGRETLRRGRGRARRGGIRGRDRFRRPDQGAGSSALYQQGRRADRTAEEDAVGPSRRGHDAVFHEPLPTSALQIRPPQADVERRNAERELAARPSPSPPG